MKTLPEKRTRVKQDCSTELLKTQDMISEVLIQKKRRAQTLSMASVGVRMGDILLDGGGRDLLS